MTWLRGLLTVVSLLAGVLIAAFFLLGPQWVDRNANQVFGDPGPAPTPETRALHAQLIDVAKLAIERMGPFGTQQRPDHRFTASAPGQ